MKKNIVKHKGEVPQTTFVTSPFDAIRRTRADGTEYWSAREMMPFLGYSGWRNIEAAVNRAKVSCENTGYVTADHFVGVNTMIDISSGVVREMVDVHLSRLGCYLVAINGDPRKPEVAAAQNYFAVMTRAAEVNGLAQQAVPAQDPILAMLEACQAQRQAQLSLEGRVDVIQQQVGNLVELRTAALRVLHDVPRAESRRRRFQLLGPVTRPVHGADGNHRRVELAVNQATRVIHALMRARGAGAARCIPLLAHCFL
jgi:hypothetical protein